MITKSLFFITALFMALLAIGLLFMVLLALGLKIANWKCERRRQRAISRAVSRIGAPTNRDMLQKGDSSWLRKAFYCPPRHVMLGENCACRFGGTCGECWRAWLDEEARP